METGIISDHITLGLKISLAKGITLVIQGL